MTALPDTLTVTIDATPYVCTRQPSAAEPGAWAFPVGEQGYPPERWYCATWHDPTGARNNGYRHTGIDLNLDVSPWGDVERRLGLSVYAVADGVVEWVGQWSGTGTVVLRVEHEGKPLWVRYGHVIPAVKIGDAVKAGDKLGAFDDWRTGDHLHFDMRAKPIDATGWLTPPLDEWLDPVDVLKAHLDASRVEAMLR